MEVTRAHPRILYTAILLIISIAPALMAQKIGPVNVNNPYEAERAKLESEFHAATPPQAAVLLERIYNLRDFVDDPAAISKWMLVIANNSAQHQLVRDEALRYLALIEAHENRLQSAESRFRELGFVRQWSIIGPFTSALSDGLTSSFGPENVFRKDGLFIDRTGKPLTWRQVPCCPTQPWINLSDFYSGSRPATGFAATSVFSETNQLAALRVSSEAAVAVFVNGSEVFSRTDETGIGFDQNAIAVELYPGWNTILLKLNSATEGSWRFAVRLTRPGGGGIQLVADASRDFPQQPSATQPATNPPIADLVRMAEGAVNSDPNSAIKLEILGQIERSHARGSEFEHLEAAAKVDPNANRWLDVAESCKNTLCRFSALNTALHLEPTNTAVLVAFANYYSERHQLEKSRDLLRQAIKQSPADFVARARLADLYTAVGLNALALDESRKLQREFPNPLWLKQKLAARYLDLGLLSEAQALLKSALSINYDGPVERGLLLRLLQKQHAKDALRAAYIEMITLNPADTRARARLAELQAASGDFASAEHTLQVALQIRPQDDAILRQLANVLPLSGKQDKSRILLATPADSDSKYLSNAAELATQARTRQLDATTDVISLSDVRIERVYDNGLSSVRTQQIFYINSKQAARDYAVRSIDYAPGSQELRIIRARLHKADGRTIEADERDGTPVAATSTSIYYDSRLVAVHFPGIEKGDVLELDYQISPTTNTNPSGDYFGALILFRNGLSQDLKRYVLITPAHRHFSIVEERMPSHATVSVNGPERTYEWEARDLDELPSEPRGPALTEIAPYVHISTFGSWSEVGRWYAALVRPQLALDSTLREVASGLLSKKRTELETIRTIHQFVLRNTHYVGFEFGIYSYKPYPVSQVYARRFGDCKDKASLMIALLRQAGVEANIALVRTRRLGDVGERATSVALFNHAVVYIPKYDLWLDGTAEYAGSRELPLDDQGALALVVSLDGRAALRRIPFTEPADNYTRRTIRAQVAQNGQIQFTGTAYTRGEDAPGLRREYEVPERQRESFQNLLAKVFPSVRLDEVRVDGAYDLENDVSVNFRGALETSRGQSSLSLSPSWMERSYVKKLAPLTSRTQDLLFPAPWTTEEEIHFALPQGAALDSIPKDSFLETPFGSASFHYEKRSGELVVTTSVQFRRVRITPAEYAAFRQFCEQVERAFHAKIKVTLKG